MWQGIDITTVALPCWGGTPVVWCISQSPSLAVREDRVKTDWPDSDTKAAAHWNHWWGSDILLRQSKRGVQIGRFQTVQYRHAVVICLLNNWHNASFYCFSVWSLRTVQFGSRWSMGHQHQCKISNNISNITSYFLSVGNLLGIHSGSPCPVHTENPEETENSRSSVKKSRLTVWQNRTH